MKQIIMFLIEAFYWILISMCPIIIVSITNIFLWNIFSSLTSCIILEIIGILLGIFLAEYIRKNYGCSNFYSKLMNTPDLEKKESKHGKADL